MKNPFQPGDVKVYERTVTDADLARFEAGLVHPVYSTFALARDAEWACRLFVLDMKEEGEEGAGVYVTVNHAGPALPGARVRIEATLDRVDGDAVHCTWRAFAGDRLIAEGTQGQRILDKARFDAYLDRLANAG